MGLRMQANIIRQKHAFVGVVSMAKLLVRRLPPCRTRCYAYEIVNYVLFMYAFWSVLLNSIVLNHLIAV